jgi:hypothetical protein
MQGCWGLEFIHQKCHDQGTLDPVFERNGTSPATKSPLRCIPLLYKNVRVVNNAILAHLSLEVLHRR